MTTTALSPLAPLARLLRLTDGVVAATTTRLLGSSGRQARMDAAGGGTWHVPLADGPFATALLAANGGPGVGAPVPALISLSLDGGATWDCHRLVQTPLRDMSSQGLTLTESGEDIFTLYSQVPAGGGRVTLAGCALADVLGGVSGTIVPLPTAGAGYQEFISADHTLPFVCGLLHMPTTDAQRLFQRTPGTPTWDADALALLRFTAVLPTEGFTAPADLAFALPTDLDSWNDNVQHALATLAEKLGAVVLAGDVRTLGERGHYVADCSDAALNIAQALAGVVCDGSPTAGSLGGDWGLSNDRTAGQEVSRAVLIGAVGAPSGLLFTDLPSAAIVDETAEAQILTNAGATIEPDATQIHGGCSFDGGASDAGFPAGGQITALTQVNRDAGDDAYTTCKALVGISVGEKTGGVYVYDDLGQLIPLNLSQSIPVLDLTVDTHTGVINAATPHGVYHRTADITNTTDPWAQVGGLTARVIRLCGVPVADTDYILYAQVVETQDHTRDGIYVYKPSVATAGQGYNGWVRLHASVNALDFQATDAHSYWYIDKNDQGAVILQDYTASPPTRTRMALPAGVVALRLDRVIGATTDTVYVTTTGDDQAAYYLSYNTGTASWVTNGLLPAYLAVGLSLQVNRFVGPLETINGVDHVEVLACTANGLFYSLTNTPTAPTDWHGCNGQNGLSGVSVTHVSAGAAQVLLGQTTNRIYAATSSDLYVSSNSGVQFDAATKGKVDYGPIFKDWIVSGTGGTGTGAPPDNSIRTAGPSLHSPLGLADSTHVQVSTYRGFGTLPEGGYLERRLTQRGSWEWELWNGDCPFTALLKDSLSDIVADESQDALTASSIALAVSRKWLWQASTPRTTLKIPSFFTQTTAKLRGYLVGQEVHVTWHAHIPSRAPDGSITDVVLVDLENEPFVVTAHDWALAADGSNYADTMTTLCTVFASAQIAPADMAAALARQIRDLKTYGAGRKRA